MSKSKKGKTKPDDGNGKSERRKRLPAEKFVTLWQKAESMDDLVKETGLAKISLSGRAASYRKRGVELRKFLSGHRGPRLDFEALNTLAKVSISD